MLGEFKEVMTKEFEMTNIGLMTYYLGIEVNQREDGSFISQAGYVREILKKFKMDNSKSINTPVKCGVKLSEHDEEEKVNPTCFKSLVGSLRYLTCTRPDILYAIGLVSRYIEDPTTTHLKIAKRILRYIKVFFPKQPLLVFFPLSMQPPPSFWVAAILRRCLPRSDSVPDADPPARCLDTFVVACRVRPGARHRPSPLLGLPQPPDTPLRKLGFPLNAILLRCCRRPGATSVLGFP
ncbi:hypothetical protein ZIOFF_038763 [Zingiber officinale]|uniref:Reverse transcriptase Ty1/copia-type domain-containing protein n=1 Tax=Zingiber officinale TaxID=94328 RepID=A0A8J5GF15_ZINOF|nr:hypothetical protein ZIOFF_038763 [Zingiber officinale]